MAEYWSHTLVEEAAGFMANQGDEVFRLDISDWPSKSFLQRNRLRRYHDSIAISASAGSGRIRRRQAFADDFVGYRVAELDPPFPQARNTDAICSLNRPRKFGKNS